MNPNIELAAEMGDPTAMRLLGNHVYRTHGRLEAAERWLQAAAQAGDAEAMYDLSSFYMDQSGKRPPHGRDVMDAADHWRRRAAESGWVAAMQSMASRRPHEREFWLRQAAIAGAPYSMMKLAELLEGKEQASEAEHWYRAAIEIGILDARRNLASLLAGQGRETEALQLMEAAVEDGVKRSRDARELADLFQRLGRAKEATVWRAKAEALRTRELEEGLRQPLGASPDLVTVATAAVITTAVIPFVQALVSKVAEDSYSQARRLIRRALHREDENGAGDTSRPADSESDTEPGLALIQDTDTGITLCLWSNASDEALRALSALDLGELMLRRPDQGQVNLVWHPASGTWRIRGHE